MPFEVKLAQDKDTFSPGSFVCRGRYMLIEKYAVQRWTYGAYETHWRAQDLQQGGIIVIICAMEVPEIKATVTQSGLRAAMRALSSVGEHPHMPVLLDVFRDSGRDCFVFALRSPGRSLLACMEQTGQKLQEQEAIACCLQITETLEAIAQQEPPIVHGFINPEHIMVTQSGQWVLTDFSIVLASRANQYLTTNLDPVLLSPFVAPEFAQGVIDSRSDMYSLLMTMYYGMTGTLSKGQVLNASLSPSLAAIFIKGLHPIASRRYQQLSALRQDLQTVRPVVNTSVPAGELTRKRNAQVTAQRLKQTNSAFESMGEYGENEDVLMPWDAQEKASFIPIMQGRREHEAQALSPSMLPRQSEALAREVLHPQLSQPARAVYARSEPPGGAVDPWLEEPTGDLLPRPEGLPPILPGNNVLAAALWITGTLLCFLISVLLTVRY